MYCLLFILSLRQPGHPQTICGPVAFRHPVSRILALSEVGCGLSRQPNLSSLFFPYQSITSLLFYFLSPLTFSKKSPNQVQQALDPGFLLPLSGQRSTLYKKKPELRKYNLLNSGFLVQNGYFRLSAKDPAIVFYFFRIFCWLNRLSIEPEYFGAINMIAPARVTFLESLQTSLFSRRFPGRS